MKFPKLSILLLLAFLPWAGLAQEREHNRYFEPFVWQSQPPADCPFPTSSEITGIQFTRVHSDYRFADTWYPAWAADGHLYSPWTDGDVFGENSNSDGYSFSPEGFQGQFNCTLRKATTGQAVLILDDPSKMSECRKPQ